MRLLVLDRAGSAEAELKQAQPFSASQNVRSTAVSHQTPSQSLGSIMDAHANPARPSHGDLNLQLLFLSCRIKG